MKILHIILITWLSGNTGFLIVCLIIGVPLNYDWFVPASMVAIVFSLSCLVMEFCALIDCVEEETSKKKNST